MSITEELTKELLEELNCNTAFTIPVSGGIAVPESVVVTWIIMAVLIIVSILLARNLSVENPGKVQLALEAGYQTAQNFFGELLGEKGTAYRSSGSCGGDQDRIGCAGCSGERGVTVPG